MKHGDLVEAAVALGGEDAGLDVDIDGRGEAGLQLYERRLSGSHVQRFAGTGWPAGPNRLEEADRENRLSEETVQTHHEGLS